MPAGRATWAKLGASCCECLPEGCFPISCTALKAWARFAPFHNWARGSFTYNFGDGDAARDEFYARLGTAFDINKSAMSRRGQASDFDGAIGDPRFSTRYRTAFFETSIDTVTDDTIVNVSYDWLETYHRYSGLAILYEGNSDCAAPYYTRAIDDSGVKSESGDANAWIDCPYTNAGKGTDNWPAAIESAGGTGTIVVTANTAELTVTFDGGTVGFKTYYWKVTLSDEYDISAALSDVEEMLDDFDLTNLSTTYTIDGTPGQTLVPYGLYSIAWIHGEDVPLEKVISLASAYFDPTGADRLVVWGNPGTVQLSKGRAGTEGAETRLYSQELTPPVPGTTLVSVSPSADDGTDAVFPDDTTCTDPHTTTTNPVYIGPGDIPYAYGKSTLLRECAAQECPA